MCAGRSATKQCATTCKRFVVLMARRGKTFLCNKLKCYLNWWVPCD